MTSIASPLTRGSGVLLPVASLPGSHGIGDMGDEAFRYVDWLADAGQQFWQVLPLGPTGFGGSPYASPSAFAGNPDLISLESLMGEGLLLPDELEPLACETVDYPLAHARKQRLLWQAFARFQPSSDFAQFCGQAAYWLDELATVSAGGDEQRDQFERFVQYIFQRQWTALKSYANERGIRIIGDMPIFVSDDGVDMRAHPELFCLDEAGRPTEVAGVPPDAFSETGQRWGNPLYRWDVMAANGYQWWRHRLRRMLELFDLVRVDHFRGLAAYWSIPAAETTAVNGTWKPGPGKQLFTELSRDLGPLPIIVEDLGLITSDVLELKAELGFPGMKVLQFAFDSDAANPYLPHNYSADCIVYTGTHDNDTTFGWYASLPEDRRRRVLDYLGTAGSEIAWELLRLAMESVAVVAVVPVQDLLSLGSEARLNAPGRADGNWRWRLHPGQLTPELAARLRGMTALYGRLPRPPKTAPQAVPGYPFGVAG